MVTRRSPPPRPLTVSFRTISVDEAVRVGAWAAVILQGHAHASRDGMHLSDREEEICRKSRLGVNRRTPYFSNRYLPRGPHLHRIKQWRNHSNMLRRKGDGSRESPTMLSQPSCVFLREAKIYLKAPDKGFLSHRIQWAVALCRAIEPNRYSLEDCRQMLIRGAFGCCQKCTRNGPSRHYDKEEYVIGHRLVAWIKKEMVD